MAKYKTTVRLERDSVRMLKEICRKAPWPLSMSALTNLLIRVYSPTFDPSKWHSDHAPLTDK